MLRSNAAHGPRLSRSTPRNAGKSRPPGFEKTECISCASNEAPPLLATRLCTVGICYPHHIPQRTGDSLYNIGSQPGVNVCVANGQELAVQSELGPRAQEITASKGTQVTGKLTRSDYFSNPIVPTVVE